jgi:hypothetical protein
VTAQNAAGTGKLWSVNPPSTAVEITPTGGAVLADANAAASSHVSAAFLENNLHIGFGLPSTLDTSTRVARLAPTATGATPTTYTRLDGVTNALISAGISPAFLEVCRDHIIAAAVNLVGAGNTRRAATRTVAWCDSLQSHVWDTMMFNSAQTYEVTEAPYGITGIARGDVNNVLVFFSDRIMVLTYTGSNPPFTRSWVQLGGNIGGVVAPNTPTAMIGARGGVANTPLGPVWTSDDNVYIWAGGPQPIGNQIRNYIREKTNRAVRILNPFWHGHWGLLCVPVGLTDANYDIFMFDPLTKAWSRQTLEIGGKLPVGTVYAPTGDSTTGVWAGNWFTAASDGHVLRETTDLTLAHLGAFVDTKDFAFDDIMADAYIDRIKVDWEPLSNTTTDIITVQALSRNHYGNILGSTGGEQNQSGNFVTQGTIVGSVQSEVSLRLRAKFVRFRFLQTLGRARIRGFSVRWQRAGDRAA